MAKLTLTDTAAGYGLTTTLNANNTAIEAAIENTLSRDGTAPNTMSVALDMNSNLIRNLATPTAATDATHKDYVDDVIQSAVAGQISGSFNVGTSWDWTATQDFWAGIKVGDAGQTDFVTMTHDGTNVLFTPTNTTDIDFLDGLGIEWHEGTNTTGIRQYYDQARAGGDALIFSGNAGHFNVDFQNTYVRVQGSYGLFIENNTFDQTMYYFGSDGVDGYCVNDAGSGLTDFNFVSWTGIDFGGAHLEAVGGGIGITKEADHPFAPTANTGILWVHDDPDMQLMYTQSNGVDRHVGVHEWKHGEGTQAVNNSTTLQTDNVMQGLALYTGDVYRITARMQVQQVSATPNLKLHFNSATGSSTSVIAKVTAVSSTGVVSGDSNTTSLVSCPMESGISYVEYEIIQTINVGATDWRVQWAQDTAFAGDTTFTDRHIEVTRIA